MVGKNKRVYTYMIMKMTSGSIEATMSNNTILSIKKPHKHVHDVYLKISSKQFLKRFFRFLQEYKSPEYQYYESISTL